MAVRGGLIVGILLCMMILPLLVSAGKGDKKPGPPKRPKQQPNPPANGQPGKGQTNPPGKGKPNPPANGQTNPPGKGKPNPPANGQPGKGQTNPPANGQTNPPGKGKPNPPANGQPGKGQTNPPANGQPKNEQARNPYSGDIATGEELADFDHKDAEKESQKRGAKLQENFYEYGCPQAENIVKEVMTKHYKYDPGVAPALVRLFFHDCFVKGCDASILLDHTPENKATEKNASHNGPLVRGYRTIDYIKEELEKKCPGTVSCADILAYASREALVLTGIPHFNVAGGRRDGLSSLATNVPGNLPLPNTPMDEMVRIFKQKNMTKEEMVVLIGAHSIGTAHCRVVAPRFHDPERSKEMDLGYVRSMQVMTICQNDTQDLPFDSVSSHEMDSRFYNQLLKNRALLESDHNIAKDPQAREMMMKLVDDQNGWVKKFTNAFIKMGKSAVLTGKKGEIRKRCRDVNKAH